MEKGPEIMVKYQLHVNDLLWEGQIHLEASCEMPGSVRFFLPAAATLPGFGIYLNGKPPTRRIDRLAVFETGPVPLSFSFQCYLPAIFSFHQLSELLPELVYPVPTAHCLSIDPPPSAASLPKGETPGIFPSQTREGFFPSLISCQRVGSAAARSGNTSITVYCSPCFTTSAEEFLAQSLAIFDQCTRSLGESGFDELKLFFDWSEPYQESKQIFSWNSGGIIYLRAAESRQITLPMILTLAHEMIHEWNGRRIYPASQREWWFLEGVTQLLAFQIVSAQNFVPVTSLLGLFSEALQQVDGLDKDQSAAAKSPFPAPFSYPQALRFACQIEGLLRRTKKGQAGLPGILRQLIQLRGGSSFSEDDVQQILGNYIDLAQIREPLQAAARIDESMLKDFLFLTGK
jgi:hypothetical protein